MTAYPKVMQPAKTTTLSLPHLLRRVVGIYLGVGVFYLLGSPFFGFPLPTPLQMLELLLAVVLGSLLGVGFSWFWPLPAGRGWERVARTLLLSIPALGLGLTLQLLLQGPQAQQAIFLVFALAAWLASGFIARLPGEAKAAEQGKG
ncbi:hypothetical protein Mrose_02202 [Calidithermus roseus]|uniref:Uncharacterized protein n=2 Tax=Calidithermus roseus TaxID=1644118 RepID=A0A399ET70_9DEIN|nr:hypothetical protein Mrose_02202 [Calidithermus roseus]